MIIVIIFHAMMLQKLLQQMLLVNHIIVIVLLMKLAVLIVGPIVIPIKEIKLCVIDLQETLVINLAQMLRLPLKLINASKGLANKIKQQHPILSVTCGIECTHGEGNVFGEED